MCHLHDRPLRAGDRVLLKHATRTVKAIVKELPYRIDLTWTTWRSDPEPGSLAVNDIGRRHAAHRRAAAAGRLRGLTGAPARSC